jgi:hypothetical protein
MGYKNPIQDLTTAFYNLIDGISVPVYKESVPIGEDGNHVIIRAESQTTTKNNSGFFTDAVILTEVVTVFETIVDRSVVDSIDNEITELLMPTPNTYGINSTDNHQVTNIQLQTSSYLHDSDGVKRYYSKISRYEFFINQISNQS